MSLVPWSQGRYLTWDATCVGTFCPSNLPHSVDVPGGAAAVAEDGKNHTYAHLDRAYIFQPIAMETSGAVGPDSLSFLRELERRLKMANGESNSYAYLLQQLSVAIQAGNAASVLGSIPSPIDEFALDELTY